MVQCCGHAEALVVAPDVGRRVQTSEQAYGWMKPRSTPSRVGDGSTDDQSAIQAAFDAGPGIMFFPPGRYLVNSPVIIPSDQHGRKIMGCGPGACVIVGPSYTFTTAEPGQEGR
jgi:hypothetical protein